MAGNFKLAVGLAIGYLLGARAGRERYERLAELAREVAQRPEARRLTDRVRSGLGASMNQAIGAAGDRLERARTAMAPSGAEVTASPEPRTEPAGATDPTDVGGSGQRSFLENPHGPPATTLRATSATGRREDRATDRMRW
jgi:hypothetical protein